MTNDSTERLVLILASDEEFGRLSVALESYLEFSQWLTDDLGRLEQRMAPAVPRGRSPRDPGGSVVPKQRRR